MKILLSAAAAVLINGALSFAFADDEFAQRRIPLDPSKVVTETEGADAGGLVDEQDAIIGPPVGQPAQVWKLAPGPNRFPASAHIDLGSERKLSQMWIYDTNGVGVIDIEVGAPGAWKLHKTHKTDKYKAWVPIQMDVITRYVRITRQDGGANFTEVAFYEYTPEAYEALQAKLAAEAKAKAEREAALAKAVEEMKKRPLVDAGAPFGKLYLIEEIDCATTEPTVQSPANVSKVETILGKKARVLPKTEKEAAFFSYRIGKMKLLEPGMTYVLEVEYPEDAPRTIVVLNGGNETSRGFHTRSTLGDALHPKYVNNLTESLDLPLSGKYETWKQLFHLHDRTPTLGFIRGDEARELTPEDGFTVTIAQFSAKNMPVSAGAAVSRIRLLAVPEPEKFNAKYTLPEGLPHRHLFWREEMADMVMNIKKPEFLAVSDPIQWWRFKRDQMRFLGMNTYTKDLLEFGAVQHWDPSEYGGNKWMYFNGAAKDTWANIVKMMGESGFTVMPYYEYAGSKGQDGLGNKRQAKPLTRDDAYTHIRWIESANVDITAPEAYEDFKKILDLTVIRHKDNAKFAGAWIRPRSQMPMSFADATRERFAKESNNGTKVTRKQLIEDKELLAKYKQWWYGKRRDFLAAMRDHLRANGVEDATILFTATPSEPGVSFKDKPNRVVTDSVDKWTTILSKEPHLTEEGEPRFTVTNVNEIVGDHLYLQAVKSEPSTWGGWEVNHAAPPSDPETYKDLEGVMLTIPFNRLYTVADPALFDAFRNKEGLAIVRHFSLNENMAFDPEDKAKLGYFIADIERAGPYCMMAEAVAMANGDPTHIGYLSGSNYARGFPEYVRNFNTAFLSLPALPSERVEDAASDPEVVVRKINTDGKGTYVSIVNIGKTDKKDVTITLPTEGNVTDAPTGEAIEAKDGKITVSLYPYQLRALRVQ
jgi:hypothetical protein